MKGLTIGGPGLTKICGLRNVEHAVIAAEGGADMLGFIFVAGARRQVTSRQAAEMIDAARASRSEPLLAVGVFVDTSADQVVAAASEAGLDLVQLNGSESPEYVANLGVPAIRAHRLTPGTMAAAALAAIASYDAARPGPVLHLVDGYDPQAHGGTGARADWALSAALAREGRIGLAGGLDPANVASVIATVRPWLVDVSSGVETDGVKDPVKIRAFLAAARAGFAAFPAR